MYEQVPTGPNYDKVVRMMSTYRSIAGRMANARQSTQGKLDRRLMKLGEQIGEKLGELSNYELMALDCYKSGFTPGTYEVDHEQLTEQPYCSIRLVLRNDLEIDVAERRESKREARAAAKARAKLTPEELMELDKEGAEYLKKAMERLQKYNPHNRL